MSLNRRQFIAFSGVALVAPPIIKTRAEELVELAELELTLALDASGSMFDQSKEGKHWYTQVAGHVYALSQQDIISKLVESRAYLRIILWSDGQRFPLIFDEPIRSASDVARARIALHGFIPMCNTVACGGTDHSRAIESVLRLPRAGFRRVLDISTDEPTNRAYWSMLNSLREDFQKQDGIINALAVAMTSENALDLQVNLCTPGGFCFMAMVGLPMPQPSRRKLGQKLRNLNAHNTTGSVCPYDIPGLFSCR